MAQKFIIDFAAHPQEILDAMDAMRPRIRTLYHLQKWVYLTLFICLLTAILVVGIFLLTRAPENPLFAAILIFSPMIPLFYIGVNHKKFETVVVETRFTTAYQVIHTLRDDVGRKGRLIGHLNLSWPFKKSKLFRTRRSSSGRLKYDYRDPWFIGKFMLVDGSVVKIVLDERIKVKRGEVVSRYIKYENKVIINPVLYETNNRSHADPFFQIISGQLNCDWPEIQKMMKHLKSIYGRLLSGAMIPVNPSTESNPLPLDHLTAETPLVENQDSPPKGARSQ
jgi:hypothetical protein